MRCFCCDRDIKLARKVKIRRWIDWLPEKTDVSSWHEMDMAAYTAFKEQMTYRWAVICHACYRLLDNQAGAAEIRDQTFTIAGASRSDRASIINEAKYRTWQQREARKLGLET